MNKTAEIHKAGYNCGLGIGLGNPVLFNFENKIRQKGIVIGYGTNMDGTTNYAILPQDKIKYVSNGTLIRNTGTKYILNGYEHEENYVFVGVEDVFYIDEVKPNSYGIYFDKDSKEFKIEATKLLNGKKYIKVYKDEVTAINSMELLNVSVNDVKHFNFSEVFPKEKIERISEIVKKDLSSCINSLMYKNHNVTLTIEKVNTGYMFYAKSNIVGNNRTSSRSIDTFEKLVDRIVRFIDILEDEVLVVFENSFRLSKKGE